MNRVLVDTNIILDLLAKRQPFEHASRQLFSLADTQQLELVVSSLSIVNAHYILDAVMKVDASRSIIGKFKVLVESYDLTDKIIELALNDYAFSDFEDAIQYYTALASKCDCILTRNLKDFKHAKLPVLSPVAYLAKRKSTEA